MRLVHFNAVPTDQYKKPKNIPFPLWSYELIGRALRQMVNLRALEWLPNSTPLFDAESNMAKQYSNLHALDPVHTSGDLCSLRKDRPYVSIFDTPYLKLVIFRQAFAGEFISCGRWPNLRTLSLLISRDLSTATAAEKSIGDFISFHSSIVSLNWHIGFDSETDLPDRRYGNPLSITSLPPGSFPKLQALDADKDLVRSLLACPCNPPRSLRKIIKFPTDVETWTHLEKNLQGTDKSTLKIVELGPIESLRQLSEFGTLFPNIESINIGWLVNIFPNDWKQSRMLHLVKSIIYFIFRVQTD
ncbi:hypothetical protein Clacol_005006 [Clathrus columnatus]|uniref:Uncharacterized protein n=1 Tax=Clathrus columnatus TaxID=1419009 RepID=A0AAV5ACA2_9AGAM|nr:hypothetical protein Clacol_005006 [Clathrus columnatus]